MKLSFYRISLLFLSLSIITSCGEDSSKKSKVDNNSKVNQTQKTKENISSDILKNIISLKGTDGKGGEIIFKSSFILPPNWVEGALTFIPSNSELLNGLALKIQQIKSSKDATTVIYTQPSIDELFY